MKDIERMEKQEELDKKQIVKYRQMYESQNRQGKLLHQENENLIKLINMPLDNVLARKVAKKSD